MLPWPSGLTWVMAEYLPPLRDIRFVLEQLVELGGLSKLEAYQHADPGTVFGLIEENGAITLSIHDPLEGGSVRGRSTNPYPGVMRPMLAWQVHAEDH